MEHNNKHFGFQDFIENDQNKTFQNTIHFSHKKSKSTVKAHSNAEFDMHK